MIVYITGASRGIGAALARQYAKPGTMLCLLDNNEGAELADVALACQQRGAKVSIFSVDVCNRQKMLDVANSIITQLGLPQIVIANAGICSDDPDDYNKSNDPQIVIATNYLGVINTFAAFIEPMQVRGSGQLVAMSSVSALRATPNSALYAASKAAVNRWTEGLRLALTGSGVGVTLICPGFVSTAMTSRNTFYMPGIISPEKAAERIAAAVQKRKKRLYFPLLAQIIWRSFHHMPDWLYDRIIVFARRHWPDPVRNPRGDIPTTVVQCHTDR